MFYGIFFGNKITVNQRTGDPDFASIKKDTRIIKEKNDFALRDTLITHEIKWKDYDSNTYEGSFSVLASDIRQSKELHQGMNDNDFSSAGMGSVYQYLGRMDENKLNRVYATFDSIKQKNNLTEYKLAETIVSCIQSIPYFLIVDKTCGADYHDEFIHNYLLTCKRDCCEGNVKFGVFSPVEFFEEIKGDCDTRALVIFILLKKFRISSVLLTSNYYRHALIAASFNDQPAINGLSIAINNRNYYLWETTAPGFKPGQIPASIGNLNYWHVSLLNQTN